LEASAARDESSSSTNDISLQIKLPLSALEVRLSAAEAEAALQSSERSGHHRRGRSEAEARTEAATVARLAAKATSAEAAELRESLAAATASAAAKRCFLDHANQRIECFWKQGGEELCSSCFLRFEEISLDTTIYLSSWSHLCASQFSSFCDCVDCMACRGAGERRSRTRRPSAAGEPRCDPLDESLVLMVEKKGKYTPKYSLIHLMSSLFKTV